MSSILSGGSSGLPLASNDPRFNVAFGELELFVATTGNDNNPGTAALPYLTPARALLEAGKFDYGYGNEPNISVAAGTYVVPGGSFGEAALRLPELVNIQGFDSGLLAGAGRGSTIFSVTGNPISCFLGGPTKSNWRIGSLTIDTNAAAGCSLGSIIEFFDTEFADTTNSGTMLCGRAEEQGTIFFQDPIVVSATTMAYFALAFYNGRLFMQQGTITLPVALTITQDFLALHQTSSCTWLPSTITNAGGVTGNALKCIDASTVYTTNGLVSDIPGSAPTGNPKIDTSSSIVKAHTTGFGVNNFGADFGAYFAEQFSGIPTGSNISPGMWTVVKDTSGGGVYVLYNDAGTIKKVALV